MKTFISLSAIFLSLTLNAQTYEAPLFLNDSSGESGQYVLGTGIQSFDDLNVASGTFSLALGSAAYATGNYSTVIGTQSVSSGLGSVAIGGGVDSEGLYSVGLGSGTLASGDYSTAMGQNTIASGDYSTAMGYYTTASGIRSTAMGSGTTANGGTSVAMGSNTSASGNGTTAMGFGTNASGFYSTTMGIYTIASDLLSLVMGQYNLAGSTVTEDSIGEEGTSANTFSLDNIAFVIGNGTNSDSRSDALVVKFNGDATLAGNLNINSDARLKANIISLGSTLSKLLQIDGKSYTMKKDESDKQKIGLLAQDIEKVFPELVSESNGIKSVNYQGLVPVLINALKEQQSEIEELKTMLKTLIEKT